ncbi:hypothetical protein R3X25_08875 [Lutibacter sp. TH_r2]|uniref:hypothetical protein n=1 Tax=Lutibacter sp. TH_r2 TaxID=3082083 RepID=UPI0029532A4D|nr:hypothetical protein [Lutibacter sp. TH_r2]MDV7187391.1 hypothetical protein [Lutibacter sp. TH_r2]
MISKKVISFFTFGVFLLIAGIILMFTKNPQATIIMTIGLIFELIAILIFVWNKLKK